MIGATRLSRRDFLRHGVQLAAAGMAGPYVIPARVFGANDSIGIAGIGIGRQGTGVLNSAAKLPGVRIVAIADVDLPRAQKTVVPFNGDAVKDYRRVLERKDVDAVITATPDHWRALVCIHACQAGKDVYAEKPLSLTIREGRLMVEAARKYKRVFQTGSQQRSMRDNRIGCALVREGAIGRVHTVIGANYPSPWNCAFPGQPVPDGLDWDMWCGPVEPVPFNKDLFLPRAKPGWISFRPYSGGEMTGWGAHGLDQIQWALGMDESGPVEVWVGEGKFDPPTYKEPEPRARGEKICKVPKLFYRYANGVVVKLDDGPESGGIFIGDKGQMKITRGSCESDPLDIYLVARKAEYQAKKPQIGHIENWLACIR
ncbi:MAG: Gfo/Idh/MocA family oxidoreductase, partial [Verrucomicrobiae bacterium]|nr:Gfo/Idh/MocA family oxidoreductase [Verrucomicrobiae bacterium]